MPSFLETSFSLPALPATLLLLLVCAYWLFVILGAFDFEVFDIDLDAGGDLDIEPSLLSLGLAPLRLLNIGEVPLMLWLSLFALSWWGVSVAVDDWAADGGTLRMAQAVLLAAGISLILTKAVTQPMRGWFRQQEPLTAEDLVGRTCTITTLEVTQQSGQARYETGASPLLLPVRSQDGVLAKGDTAEIVGYDSQRRVYFVARIADSAGPPPA